MGNAPQIERKMRRAWRARPELLICGALAFSALVYCAPMVTLASWAFRDGGNKFSFAQAIKLVNEPAYITAFVTTFQTAAVTTIVCVLLGYPLAYLMATTSPRARLMLAAAVMIPFWTSVLARSLAWVILLGRKGVVNEWLRAAGITNEPLALLFNSIGVQIGMAHVLLPFMVLPIWSVLMRLDPALPRAARSLGASPARTFFEVTLPLSLPGLIAGVVLVFMLAIGFYITPALLGGEGDITIAGLIEMVVRDLLDWPFGAMLSLILLAIVAAIFAVGACLVGVQRMTGVESKS